MTLMVAVIAPGAVVMVVVAVVMAMVMVVLAVVMAVAAVVVTSGYSSGWLRKKRIFFLHTP